MSLYRAAVCATFATTLTVFPAVTAPCGVQRSQRRRASALRPRSPGTVPAVRRPLGAVSVSAVQRRGSVRAVRGERVAESAPRRRAAATAAAAANRVDSAPPRVQRRRRRSMAFPALVRGLGPRPDRARRRPRLHQRTPRERVRDVRPRVGAALAESRGGSKTCARRRRGDSDGMRLVVRSQRRDASVRHERERG